MFRLLVLSGLLCAVWGIDLVQLVDEQISDVKATQEERRSEHLQSVREFQHTIQGCEKAISKAKENIIKFETQAEENSNKEKVHTIERDEAEAKLSLIGDTFSSRIKRYKAYQAQCTVDLGKDGGDGGVLGSGISKVNELIGNLVGSKQADNKVEKGGGATVKKTKFKSGKVVELLKTFRNDLIDTRHEREQECTRAKNAMLLAEDNHDNEEELADNQKRSHDAKRLEHASKKSVANDNASTETTVKNDEESLCEQTRESLASENASFAKDEKGFRSYMNSLDKAKEMLKENVKYIPGKEQGGGQFLQTIGGDKGPDGVVQNVLEHLSRQAVFHHIPSLVTFVSQLKNQDWRGSSAAHRASTFLHRRGLRGKKDSSTWFEKISNKIFNRIDALEKEKVTEGTLFRDTKNKMRATQSSIEDLALTIDELEVDNKSSKAAASIAAENATNLTQSISTKKTNLANAKEEFRGASVANAKQVKELGHAIEAVERIIVHFQDGDENIENKTMKQSRDDLTSVFKEVLGNCEENKENAIADQHERERDFEAFKSKTTQLIDSEIAALSRQNRLNDQAVKKSVMLSEKIKSREKEQFNFEDYQERLFKSYGNSSELEGLFNKRNELRGKEIKALRDAYNTLVSWKKDNE